MRYGAAALIAAAASLTAACAPATRPQAPEECLGTMVLMVRNNTGTEVEIVEHLRGMRTVVAMVGPGMHVVDIRNEREAAYSAQLPHGRLLTVTSRPRVRDRAVTLERTCRRT